MGRQWSGGMVDKLKENKIAVLVLLTGVVYFFLQYLVPLTAPVLVALLFLTIFGAFLKKMQEKLHIHRQIGAVLLLILAGILLIGILMILLSWIVGSLPVWMKQVENSFGGIQNGIRRICETVGEGIGVDSDYLEEIILLRLDSGLSSLQERLLPGVLNQSIVYVRSAIAIAGFLVVFLIATILLAKDYDEIFNQMLDREEFHVVLKVICGVIRYVATYVKAQLILMGMIGALAALTLGIGGIRHGFLWGILAGILDALPFIGTGCVLVPMAIVQFFYGAHGKGFLCIGLYMACIFVRELLEPRLIGKSIGVKPIAILLSLYAGIQLFGVAGIVKGPLGFILIYETWKSLEKKS